MQSPKSHSFFQFPDSLTIKYVQAAEFQPTESEGIRCRPLLAGSVFAPLFFRLLPRQNSSAQDDPGASRGR